jgi:hypothetical protein
MATVKKRGFDKHETSEQHLSAMKQWKEKQHREDSNTKISTLLSRPNPEHRTWLFAVFSVVKFLVMNGLPLRGDVEVTDFNEGVSGGLFLNTFSHLLFKMDPGLEALARRLPDNAKYTSGVVQNEVIDILADCHKGRIAEACKNSGTKSMMSK